MGSVIFRQKEAVTMFGLGTIINTAAIIAGGILGGFFGNLLKERHQDSLCKACGVCTLFIGITGALEGMLTVEGNSGDACKIKSYSLTYECIKGYGLMNW